MLTEKQEIFFNIIINLYKTKKEIPTIGLIKKNSNYKSYNTIYKYLNLLDKKGFIKLTDNKKKIVYINEYLDTTPLANIPIINDKRFIQVSSNMLKLDEEYLAFKLENNKLNSFFLKCKDILIIEKNLNNINNKLILANIDNKYYILKYIKKDGFIHLFNDKDFFIYTNSIKIIGKVILTIRETME